MKEFNQLNLSISPYRKSDILIVTCFGIVSISYSKISYTCTAEQIRWVFGDNLGIISLVFHKNVCCGYSLESPRRGDFNESRQ